ncbi:flagellar protein FlaI, partial [Candidatus Bathyarchaeota archaeon]
QLLKAALRQRPTYIIVGEIRGQEGAIAFQAMQTGHPVLATFHAASVNRLVQRLTGSPINIPKTYIDNLNAVLIQSAVHNPKSGRYERRVLSVNEILGYEPAEQQFNFVEVVSWEPSTDTFEFRGMGSSYLLENKIAIMKGISKYELRKIYEELETRAKILEYMLKLGILDYYDVWKTLVWVYNVGVNHAFEKLRQNYRAKVESSKEAVAVKA